MKKILTLTIPAILIFFSCCEKEESPIPDIYWGEVSATKNGVPWTGKIRAAPNTPFGYGFDIRVDVYEYDILKESLVIARIPFKEKRNPIDTISLLGDTVLTGASYATKHWDLIESFYKVFVGDIDNFINVSSYNETTREVEGEFEVMFVNVIKSDAASSLPDTLRFTNGRFHTRIDELD